MDRFPGVRAVGVLPAGLAAPDRTAPVVIVGAGACGLCAAMAARDQGVEAVVLERDATPRGNTSWSVGMIPAAGSKIQRARGVDDSPQRFAADILKKAHGQTDAAMVHRLAHASGPTIDWLVERHGLQLGLLEDIVYPGHACARYHVPPSVTGAELHAMLMRAAAAAGVRVLADHRVERLHAEPDGRIAAVGGGLGADAWTLGCETLVLATDGFAADPQMVTTHIPEMADAISFGHPGAGGDSLRWGQALGAKTADLGAYQGHHLVTPERLPLTWAVIIDGGVQVNRQGRRFANEMRGYSEQAADILRQPDGLAWTIYDSTAERNALTLETYRTVAAAGVVRRADSVADLAASTGLPSGSLAETLAQVEQARRGEAFDPFGRDFSSTPPLRPPYLATPTTGALYHTQGGLVVDPNGRVLRKDGSAFPNLFAGGGAARGVSGPAAWGYLGGNGLLCAVVLGRLAGDAAARSLRPS